MCTDNTLWSVIYLPPYNGRKVVFNMRYLSPTCTYGPKPKIARSSATTCMLTSESTSPPSLVQWGTFCCIVGTPVTKKPSKIFWRRKYDRELKRNHNLIPARMPGKSNHANMWAKCKKCPRWDISQSLCIKCFKPEIRQWGEGQKPRFGHSLKARKRGLWLHLLTCTLV